jgi:hypothetical protein
MSVVYDDARIATIKEQIAKEQAAGDRYETLIWKRELESTMSQIKANDEKERHEKTQKLNKASEEAMLALEAAQNEYNYSVEMESSFRKTITDNASRGHETSNAKEILSEYVAGINYKWNVLRVAEQKAMGVSLKKEAHDAYCAFRNMAKLPQISYEEMQEMLAAAPKENDELMKAHWIQKTAEMRSRYWTK